MNKPPEQMPTKEMPPTGESLNIEQSPKLSAGLELDSRFEDIRSELVSEWRLYTGRDVTSEEGQNFLYGDPSHYIQGGRPSPVEDTVKKIFEERFPEDAIEYQKLEKVRVYDNPTDDPAMKKVDDDILLRVNRDSKSASDWQTNFRRVEMDTWDSFLIRYPEKAAEYAKFSEPVGEAIDRAKRRAEWQNAERQRRNNQVEAAEPRSIETEQEEEVLSQTKKDIKSPIEKEVEDINLETSVEEILPTVNLEDSIDSTLEDYEAGYIYQDDSEARQTIASPAEVKLAQRIDDQVKIEEIRRSLLGTTGNISEWQVFALLSSVSHKSRFVVDHGKPSQQVFEIIPGKQEYIVVATDTRGQYTKWKVSAAGKIEAISSNGQDNQSAAENLKNLMKKFLEKINSKEKNI